MLKNFLKQKGAGKRVQPQVPELTGELVLKAQELYVTGLYPIDKIAEKLKVPKELVLMWKRDLDWDRARMKFVRELHREIQEKTKKKIASWISEMDSHLAGVIEIALAQLEENKLKIKSAESALNLILKAITERVKIIQLLAEYSQSAIIDMSAVKIALPERLEGLPIDTDFIERLTCLRKQDEDKKNETK